MSKLELWEFLYEDRGWHKATDLRERFSIKQQMTLKNWTEVPFIMSYVGNKGKMYRFNTTAGDEYEKAIAEEVYVPPLKLKNGKEIAADIPVEEPEYYTIRFPFPRSDVGKIANKEMKGIARLGPEWNWAKQAIIGLDEMKFSNSTPLPKQVVEVLIVSLSAIIGYNGVNFEGVQAIKDSLEPKMTLDDIREAELQDIMKHLPVGPKETPNIEDIDYDSFFGKAP